MVLYFVNEWGGQLFTNHSSRPGKGNAVFITLEDETSVLNLIIWHHLTEQQRRIVLSAKLPGVWADIQRAAGVQHLIVRRLYGYSHLRAELRIRSRDFH
jgi:error-prone DNA polymerase